MYLHQVKKRGGVLHVYVILRGVLPISAGSAREVAKVFIIRGF